MSRHYLDHASTSPLRPEAREAMIAMLREPVLADPGRVHTEGRMSRVALEDARERVAGLLRARPREVVFTSGATEAINAAIYGVAARWADQHSSTPAAAPIATAAVEHSSVTAASARHRVIDLPVDGKGRLDLDGLAGALADDADIALVNVQWGNHEVGTLQPVADVIEAAHERDVLVHVDAAQAAGRVAIDFGALGVDLLSVSGHKLGGPQGTGALLVRRGLRLPPFIVGGEQERARRGGMENVAAMIGFGAAAFAATEALEAEAARSRRLTAAALEAATSVPGVTAYGDTEERLPHLICVGVDGVEAEAVLLGLDQAGIAAHSGSACSSESLEPSPVLQAMGVEAERSLRVSVGWDTTDADIDAFVTAFPSVIERLRGLRR